MIYHCQDILEKLGIIINFKIKQITWDEVSVHMRSLNTIGPTFRWLLLKKVRQWLRPLLEPQNIRCPL